MNSVVSALVVALKTLFQPKMLLLMLWPVPAATVLWAGAAWLFWNDWTGVVSAVLQGTPLAQWMAGSFLAGLSRYVADVVVVLLLLGAIYVTALLITGVFAMPIMLGHVAREYYPELERKQGGSAVGGVANAVVAVAIYCVGWVLSLPLWLFSPLALVLPVLLAAQLNQRLFRYDALAEHASREEFEQLVTRAMPRLFLLGIAVGVLQFVPVLNLVAPVYAGLAFIHLCLAELKRMRQSA